MEVVKSKQVRAQLYTLLELTYDGRPPHRRAIVSDLYKTLSYMLI